MKTVSLVNVSDPVERRMHIALKSEMTKKRPNTETVSAFLDNEFKYRRTWMEKLEKDRVSKILARYPCFRHYQHVSKF